MVTALLFPPVQLLAACQRRRAACRCGAARHPERAAPGDAPPQNGTMSGRRPLQEGRGAIMQPPTLQGLPGGGQKHGSAPGTPVACALCAAAQRCRHLAWRESALPAGSARLQLVSLCLCRAASGPPCAPSPAVRDRACQRQPEASLRACCVLWSVTALSKPCSTCGCAAHM